MGRQRLPQLAFIWLLALSALAAMPTPTHACSCADGAPDWEVVFIGRVVAVVEGVWVQEQLWQHDEGYGSTVALLQVEHTWQGSDRRFALVVGGTSQGDCMLRFVPGVRYKINTLDDGRGLLYTNTCIGSRQMADSGA